MSLEWYYALTVIVIVTLVLGIDLSKPRGGMCPACARVDKRYVLLRTGIVDIFLVVGMSGVVVRKFFPVDAEMIEWGIAFLAALAFVSLLIGIGMGFGMRYQHKIWVPTSQ